MATNYSDETFGTLCSTCQTDNKQTEGDVFCLDCQDYYCSKCFEFHKKMPALSGHKIIEKSEFHSKITKGSLPIVPTERCMQHSTKVVDMYCTDHKIVACHVCTTLEHTFCKKLYVPEHIESLLKFLDVNECLSDCADVGLAAKQHIKVIEENLKTLKDEKGNALNELKSFKKELIVWLDKVEKRAIEKLDAECAVIESKWTNTIAGLQRGIEDMNQCVSKLNSATQNQAQQFVCACRCKSIASSAKQQTQETYPSLKDIKCIFTPCLELQALIKSHDILGTSIVALNCSQNVTSLQSINNQPTSGRELADLMHVGAKIVPGKDWAKYVVLPDLQTKFVLPVTKMPTFNFVDSPTRLVTNNCNTPTTRPRVMDSGSEHNFTFSSPTVETVPKNKSASPPQLPGDFQFSSPINMDSKDASKPILTALSTTEHISASLQPVNMGLTFSSSTAAKSTVSGPIAGTINSGSLRPSTEVKQWGVCFQAQSAGSGVCTSGISVVPTSEAPDLRLVFKSTGWICSVCLLNNKDNDQKCMACQTVRPEQNQKGPTSNASVGSVATTQPMLFGQAAGMQIMNGSGLSALFKTSEWTCETCLLNNKMNAEKCVACQTVKSNGQKPNVAVFGLKSDNAAAVHTQSNTAFGKPTDLTQTTGSTGGFNFRSHAFSATSGRDGRKIKNAVRKIRR